MLRSSKEKQLPNYCNAKAEQKAKEDAEVQKAAELEAEAKAVQEAKQDEQKTIIHQVCLVLKN